MKRKENKMLCVTSIILCGALLFSLSAVPVFANSAQTHWEGISLHDVIFSGEESPIIVEKEVLTFDIQEFPAEYYWEVDDYLLYSGKVTAEYTFYNPADYTVTAKLVFPFGNEPMYAATYDGDTETNLHNVDTNKFDITINGEVIEKKLRYTLSEGYEQFDLNQDLALLHDDYLKDGFYSTELPVTKYTYKISGVDTEKYHAANAAFDVPVGNDATRIFFPEQSGGHTQKETLRVSAWVENNGASVTIYAIGEPFATLPQWKFYKNGGVEDKEEIEGTMTLESTETFTFKELALSNWKIENGVSEVDWYNAIVTAFNNASDFMGYGVIRWWGTDLNITADLMRWYEYEITLGPGERIVNAVTAPIYPSIELEYTPAIYNYTYLLSPALTWREFGELEIIINTPYYMIESGIEGFAKKDTGYTLTLDGLPEGELEFTLCASENPEKPVGTITDYIPLEIIISFSIIGGVVLLMAGGITALLLIRRKKKNKTKG